MIVITNPIAKPNEMNLIHSLFENGLEVLHIRKPDFSAAEMNAFLSKIAIAFRPRLVLHSHHELALRFGISRIHFTEKKRIETPEAHLKKWKKRGYTLSTSIHQRDDVEQLSNAFDYAFFGPVFESISKPNYRSNVDFEKELKLIKNKKPRLVALGGITPQNSKTALEYGFNDIALLGCIWNSNQPMENFKLCQKNAHLL
ncbi:thiamine phosphate synthase [Flavobacterium sp.]|jgi:thiamine-phosphate pyrophosphorylase|uniref:thiamine phosphate synthase n=1 Tax=Flavobacterium sp. TaxID=239 RepID=UPI0022BB6EF9|nr:thiamine phosphate synthase [Flavobacterium sp.]MCZ8230512.1 thiamine phosphate synthase [Flavobacterium sp.]